MPNPSAVTEVRQPKLKSYCNAFYALMYDDSFIPENDPNLRLWRGHITKATDALGIPKGTYKRIMDQLTALHCIELVERGFRGSSLSTVILLRPPTDEVWQDERLAAPDLTRGEAPAILSARIKEIERRLPKIDLVKALGELQQQIGDLNKRFDELQQQMNKESG